MSDIINPKGNFRFVRLTSDDAYHCLNNVIDVGEITAHLSMIEHADVIDFIKRYGAISGRPHGP